VLLALFLCWLFLYPLFSVHSLRVNPVLPSPFIFTEYCVYWVAFFAFFFFVFCPFLIQFSPSSFLMSYLLVPPPSYVFHMSIIAPITDPSRPIPCSPELSFGYCPLIYCPSLLFYFLIFFLKFQCPSPSVLNWSPSPLGCFPSLVTFPTTYLGLPFHPPHDLSNF